jgi:hypothetical protein
MPSDVCDYRSSFLAFTTRGGGNTARIQIDARCHVFSVDGTTSREYVLITPCRAENTHASSNLIMDPNYEFTGIFQHSRSDDAEYLLMRTYADHDPYREHEWEAGRSAKRFDKVEVTIASCDEFRQLTSPEEIVKMTLANRPLIARTSLKKTDGLAFEVEYPVKTINVVGSRWQIDTGPILVPRRLRKGNDPVPRGDRAVERFDQAFVVYNTLDSAEFVLRQPTPVGDGSSLVWHYSEIVVAKAKTEIFAIMD